MIPRPGHRPDHQFHRAHRRQQSCGTSGSYASRFGSRLRFLALSNSYLMEEIVDPLKGIPFFHGPFFFVLYALEVGNVFWPDVFRRLELVGYLLQAFYHEVVVNMAPEKAHKTVKTSRVMGEAIDANPVRDIRRYGFGQILAFLEAYLRRLFPTEGVDCQPGAGVIAVFPLAIRLHREASAFPRRRGGTPCWASVCRASARRPKPRAATTLRTVSKPGLLSPERAL